MNKVPGKMKCYQHLKQLQSLCISGALPFQRRAGRVFDYGAWRLGLFFSLPIDLTWESWSEDGPSLASKLRACFPIGCLSWGEGPFQSFGEPGQQERPRRASGSCYLPGGAEVFSSSERAGSHPGFCAAAGCVSEAEHQRGPCALCRVILWSLRYHPQLPNEETEAEGD